MKATKKDLKKLEKNVAGVRDLVAVLPFSSEDKYFLCRKLEDAEDALRAIANALKN